MPHNVLPLGLDDVTRCHAAWLRVVRLCIAALLCAVRLCRFVKLSGVVPPCVVTLRTILPLRAV